jgi:hypothetical protein
MGEKMNHLKPLQKLASLLVIVFLTGCMLYVSTPQQQPIQPGDQQGGQQPGGPQPDGPQPEGPQPGEPVGPVDGVGESPLEPTLADQMVMIPGGGGFAEITFTISNEQRIEIILEASNPGIQPYGSLQHPDGRTEDCPMITGVQNGRNDVEIPISQSGQYTLTIFDGSNQGGDVHVVVVGVP